MQVIKNKTAHCNKFTKFHFKKVELLFQELNMNLYNLIYRRSAIIAAIQTVEISKEYVDIMKNSLFLFQQIMIEDS